MTTPATDRPVRPVGVDIQESEQNRGVIEAIEADNPDATVLHMPGLVRVISYFGHIKEWDDDQILIAWDH